MAKTTKTNKFKINSVNLDTGQVEVTYINKNGPIETGANTLSQFTWSEQVKTQNYDNDGNVVMKTVEKSKYNPNEDVSMTHSIPLHANGAYYNATELTTWIAGKYPHDQLDDLKTKATASANSSLKSVNDGIKALADPDTTVSEDVVYDDDAVDVEGYTKHISDTVLVVDNKILPGMTINDSNAYMTIPVGDTYKLVELQDSYQANTSARIDHTIDAQTGYVICAEKIWKDVQDVLDTYPVANKTSVDKVMAKEWPGIELVALIRASDLEVVAINSYKITGQGNTVAESTVPFASIDAAQDLCESLGLPMTSYYNTVADQDSTYPHKLTKEMITEHLENSSALNKFVKDKGGMDFVYRDWTLAYAKVHKKIKLNEERQAAEEGGFSYSGKTVDSDLVSQQRINATAWSAQVAKDAGDAFSVDWLCADNSTKTMDEDAVIGMAKALADHIATQHAAYKTKKASVDSAGTISAVNAV